MGAELFVRIGARIDEFSRAMSKVESQLQSTGQRMQNVGAGLTKAVTLPIAAVAGVSTKAAIDFESAFAGVRKTVKATEPEFKKLEDGFRKLSKEIPVSANELAKIGETAGQLGVKTQDILGFTRVMADLGVTTNLSSDQAATALARFAAIIDNEAGPQFDKLGSVIVALGNTMGVTESDILEFGLRIAASGDIVGLTEDQILAFGAALGRVGIDVEAGGTAISKVFTSVFEAVLTGGDKLNEFARVAGMSAASFRKAYQQDAAGAIVSFVEGLGRIQKSGGNVFAVLRELEFQDERLKRALTSAANAGDLLRSALDIASEGVKQNNALTKEAEQRYKTTASQLIILKNNLQDAAISLGQGLTPLIKEATKELKPFTDSLGAAAERFRDLPDPARKTAVGIGLFLAAIGPGVFILGSFLRNLSSITAFFAGSAGIASAIASWGVPLLRLAGWVGAVVVAMQGLEAVMRRIGWTPEGKPFAGDPTGALGLNQSGLARVFPAGLQLAPAPSHGPATAGTTGAGGAGAPGVVGRSKELTDAIDELRKKFAGTKIEAQAWLAVLPEMGRGMSHLSKTVRFEVAASLDTLIDRLDMTTAAGRRMALQLMAAADAARLTVGFGGTGITLGPTGTLGRFIGAEAPPGGIEAQLPGFGVPTFFGLLPGQNMPSPSMADLLPFGIGLPSMPGRNVGLEADPTRGAGGLFRQAFGSSRDFGQQFAGTAMQALMGGGNIAEALTGMVGSGILGSVAQTITSGAGLAIGGVAGGALNAVLPGIGALAGPLLGKLFGGLFGKSKGRREDEAASAEIGKLQAQLVESLGGMERLRGVAQLLGSDIENSFGHKGRKGLEAFKQEMAAFTEQVEKLQDAMPEITDLLDQAAQFGGQLPEKFGPFIEQLRSLGLLQGEQEFRWQTMQEAAERYGIEMAGLGAKFQSARLHDSAEQILTDFELLTSNGADAAAVLSGMSDEISSLVTDSIQFGTTIPENMRPMIEKLIASGQLLDANGQKMTDISGITFGDPIVAGLDKVVARLDALLEGLGIKLPNAIEAGVTAAVEDAGRLRDALESIPSEFTYRWNLEGGGDGFGGREMAHGGIVTRPTFALIGERGPEAVIPLNRMGGPVGGDTTIIIELDGQVIARKTVPHIPGVIKGFGV